MRCQMRDMTIAEASSYSGMLRTHILAAINTGLLPAESKPKPTGKKAPIYYVRRSDVDALVERMKSEESTPLFIPAPKSKAPTISAGVRRTA